MTRVNQPKYACYILDNGVAVGKKANLEKHSYLEMQDGRSVKVTDRYISLENCAIIPFSKLPNLSCFEGMRYKQELEEPLLKEYCKAEKYQGAIKPAKIIKPFTIFESDLVKRVERKMAPVKKRLETLRRKKREKREKREEQGNDWKEQKQIIKGLKEI